MAIHTSSFLYLENVRALFGKNMKPILNYILEDGIYNKYNDLSNLSPPLFALIHCFWPGDGLPAHGGSLGNPAASTRGAGCPPGMNWEHPCNQNER